MLEGPRRIVTCMGNRQGDDDTEEGARTGSTAENGHGQAQKFWSGHFRNRGVENGDHRAHFTGLIGVVVEHRSHLVVDPGEILWWRTGCFGNFG